MDPAMGPQSSISGDSGDHNADYDTAGTSHAHRKNRRKYAADQFNIANQRSEFNAYGADGMPPVAPGAGAAGMQAPTAAPYQQSMAAPAYNARQQTPTNVSSVTEGIAGMGFGCRNPLNELHNIDLVNQMPSVTMVYDTPPAVTLPERASLTPSKDANGPNQYVRCTLNAIPTTHSLLKKSKLPFALILRPYIALRDEDETVPVVRDQIIARCRRCRAYIHPFAVFVEDGQRWRCTMCNLVNDVPQGFDWDIQANQKRDRWTRAELNHSVVDFIAPQEYMVRPPQPLFMVFVIDVSASAVQSGLVATAARAIQESLDRIPNDEGRTKIAFICVDSSLHFFSLSSDNCDPNMLVISDLEAPFLPQPDDLLLSLQDSRKGIDGLLEKFTDLFAATDNGGFALGPALKSAHKLIGGVGGKVISIMASLPNLGEGKLAVRDDTKVWGSSKQAAYLQTQNPFYRSFAVECSKSQVSVDMFCLSRQYQDVASLSCLPRYTGGQTHHYPFWSAVSTEDAVRFAHDLSEHLSMEVALEAVMRVRGTSGLRMQAFYGNFFNRSSDLCAFPSFPRDQGYVVEVSIDETQTKPFVILQTAVLHSTCHGERRIRVITFAIPTTESFSDLFASADQVAIATYFSFRAAERALSAGFDSAREQTIDRLTGILEVYRKHLTGQNTGASLPLQIGSNLHLLPLLCLALIKHVALRPGNIPSDSRSAALNYLSTFPPQKLIPYILPQFYCLHAMPEDAGLPSENGIVLPPQLNLSSQNIEFYGLYVIFDGINLILWIGKEAVPLLIEDVFGVSSLQDISAGKTTLPVLDTALNQKIHNIMSKLCSYDKGTILQPQLWVIRGGVDMALQNWAFSMLIEDRAESQPSYQQFISQLKSKAAGS